MSAPSDCVDESKTSRYRWGVFILLSSMYLLVFFHRQAPAVLALDLMRDLDLKGASLGLLSAAFFYPYAFIQLPAGTITRTFGARKTVCAFFLLAGLGAIGFSFATSFPVAVFFRLMVGVGTGMVLVPVLEIMAAWFKREDFASMVGLLIGVGGLGVFAGATPLSLLDRMLGWRGSFQGVGVVSVLLVVCAWIWVRDTPQEKGCPPTGDEPEPVGLQENGGIFSQAVRVLATPAFWPPTLWAFLAIGVFISFGGLWGGPYLMHVHGLDKVETGHILGMLALGMILGGPLLGCIAERVLKSRKRVLMLAGGGLVLLMGRMAFDFGSLSLWGLYAWFGLLGLTTMAAAPLALTLIRNVFSGGMAATATGVANFFFLAGGAVMQQATGWLLDAHGYSASGGGSEHYDRVFVAYFVCALLAFVATVFSREQESF